MDIERRWEKMDRESVCHGQLWRDIFGTYPDDDPRPPEHVSETPSAVSILDLIAQTNEAGPHALTNASSSNWSEEVALGLDVFEEKLEGGAVLRQTQGKIAVQIGFRWL